MWCDVRFFAERARETHSAKRLGRHFFKVAVTVSRLQGEEG